MTQLLFVALGIIAGIVAGALVEWLLPVFLPEKPSKMRHVVVAVLAVVVFTLVAAVPSLPRKPDLTTPDPTATMQAYVKGYCEQAVQPRTVGYLSARSKTPEPFPYVTIDNPLLMPVKVYADGLYRAQIEPGGSKTLVMDSYPVNIRWDIVRSTDSNGQPIGDEISGEFLRVFSGDWLFVAPDGDNGVVFFPVVSNNSGQECDVTINEGLPQENQCCLLHSGGQQIGLGYYWWVPETRVTFQCGQTRTQRDLPPMKAGGDPPYSYPDSGEGVIVLSP